MSAVIAGARSVRVVAAMAEIVGAAFVEDDKEGGDDELRWRQARRLRLGCRRALQIHGVRVHLRGRFPVGPCVVVSNHVSWLDPVVIGSQLPVAPIAKHEVRRWPLVGSVCEALGVMFVERGSAASGAKVLRASRAALEDGVAVLGFPEGTTTDGDRVLPFARGLFGLARHLKVPVVPVSLRYADDACRWVGDDGFVGHWLSLARKPGLDVEISIGPSLRALPGAPLRRFVDDAHNTVTALLMNANARRIAA